MSILIIDYGMGNLRNVQKALEFVGATAHISSQADDIGQAAGLVLPGVGAFGDAMDNLRAAGLIGPILQAVSENKPLLGICLGMQLLFDQSDEMGLHRGLGLIAGQVTRFAQGLKVPHIGWNQLQLVRPDDPLLQGIPDLGFAYFVHSYYVAPADTSCVLATTHYGLDFASVVGRGRVWGAQFHPEKSQDVGLRLLSNFAALVSAGQEPA